VELHRVREFIRGLTWLGYGIIKRQYDSLRGASYPYLG